MMQHHHNVPNGTQIPNPQRPPQRRALLITEQAQRWAGYVLERARMRPETVYRKALDSIGFSFEMKARALAVPSKLTGTSKLQQALVRLHELNLMKGHRLDVQDEGDSLIVSFADMEIGRVQGKHVPWLSPLVSFGATVHFLTLTGIDRDQGYWGCNIAFAHVAAAIDRLTRSSGDGMPESVQPAEDVYLWRDKKGIARASVPHTVKHSPTGIEWGYMGSGPADLSRSILLRHTTPEEAERLYQRFKRDVIATLPEEGGRIRAAFVISWLYAHGA